MQHRSPRIGTWSLLCLPFSPGMVGKLVHVQHDTFRAEWDDANIEPAYVTFALDAEGRIDRVTMKAVSPIADFSFNYQDLLFTPVSQ